MAALPPPISVLIPAFNRADRLGAVLASVYAQTACPPFEVIVVDDASTDDTAGAIARAGFPVRLVRHERNGGIARARQTGADEARGTLLAFHDSDDFMLPGRLGLLATHLDDHPHVGAVFADGVVERDQVPTGERIVPRDLGRRLDGRTIGVRDIVRDGLPMYLQAALIRRDVFEAAGGVDTTLARHADLELACRVVLEAPATYLDVPVFRYQLHDANQTRDRLKLREGLAMVMQRLREGRPEAVAAVGARWFRRREARHHYRIARARWRAGEPGPARASICSAVALEPLSIRYRVLAWRLRAGRS